jgi:hypothetical protein
MHDHGLLAYVGPGPGLTMAWAFIALMGTIALAVLSLLIWPIRLLIRRLRGTAPAPTDTQASAAAATSKDADHTSASR